MNNFLNDYLTFSRRDRIGIIALLSIIIIIYFLPFIFAKRTTAFPLQEDTALANAMKLLGKQQISEPGYKIKKGSPQYTSSPVNTAADYNKASLFNFDPNMLSAQGWERLGLSQKTIKTLIHFREKGGKFYKPEDLKKIWGLPQGFYERVENFITIPIPPGKAFYKETFKAKEKRNLTIDINTADSNAFIALPGIGNKLAVRIINFRNKLGGFYSIDQIGETYGLPDSTFRLILPFLQLEPGRLKKVNINTAELDELKAHPYIKWSVANAIIAYRKQHGSFLQPEELLKISIITNAAYTKMAPYLTTQ